MYEVDRNFEKFWSVVTPVIPGSGLCLIEILENDNSQFGVISWNAAIKMQVIQQSYLFRIAF